MTTSTCASSWRVRWRMADVARHDPDHLRRFSRHATGIHHLDLSMRCLPSETNLGRRTDLVR